MPSSFSINPKLSSEIEAQASFRAEMERQAEDVKQAADELRHSIPDDGEWMPRAGHEPIEVQEIDGEPAVVNTDHAGHLIEWGGRNNPPYALLRRAARQAGMRKVTSE